VRIHKKCGFCAHSLSPNRFGRTTSESSADLPFLKDKYNAGIEVCSVWGDGMRRAARDHRYCCKYDRPRTARHWGKNVLLIHGAWADGSSWSKVVPLLEAKGLHVVAVQIPLTSFADDVSATQRAIALEDGPLLLVGHSYGGAVITEAGNDPKVAGLVYVAAVAPDKGESALGLITSVPTPVGSELRPDKSGFLKLTPKGIAEDFAQDLSAKEIAVLTATQGPTSVGAMKGEITTPLGSRSRRGTSSPQMTGQFHPISKRRKRRKSGRLPPPSPPATWLCWPNRRRSPA